MCRLHITGIGQFQALSFGFGQQADYGNHYFILAFAQVPQLKCFFGRCGYFGLAYS